PVQMTVTPLTGVPAYTHTWTSNSAVLGNSTTLNVAPQETTIYVVETTDQCTLVSDTVVVTTYDVPDVDISVLADEGCAPMDVTFFLDIDPALVGAGSCVWNVSDGS